MKISLVTQYLPTEREDYSNLANLTIPNRQEWCDRHGYFHYIQKGNYKFPDMYYAYDRLVLLRELLDKPDASDFYWVLNIQAVITNFNKKIEDIVNNSHDFWVTKDVNGINMGSFIVANTKWSREWLDFIISLEPIYRNDCWKEQRAIMHNWENEKWQSKICILPQDSINSYFYHIYKWPKDTPGNWKSGDLVVNLPGMNLNERIDTVKKIFNDNIIIK